jgi:YHS domain-containing protein
MNLRGNNRLRLFLMGVAAAGICHPAQFVQADGKLPVPVSSKRAAAKPETTVASDQPNLLAVPDRGKSAIQLVAQNDQAVAAANQKSEVMRQLELLYEQDGREMPDLNTDIRPVPATGTPNSAGTPSAQPAANGPLVPSSNAPAQTQPNTAPNGLRIQQVPAPQNPSPAPTVAPAEKTPGKNPVMSFFKKLIPGRKDPKATPAPADYRPDVAPIPPVASGNPNQLNPGSTGRMEYAPARIGGNPNSATSAALPPLDATPHSPFELPISRTAEALPQPLAGRSSIPPAPTGEIPPLAADPVSLPELLTQPQPTDIASSAKPRVLDTTVSNSGTQQAGGQQAVGKPTESNPTANEPPASSPFTEMSEQEADKKLEMNPYTGLTLDEEISTKPRSADAPLPSKPDAATAPGSKSAVDADDPFAEELRKLGLIPEKREPVVTTEPTLQVPLSESPTFDGIADETTREKMKKIHERGGMKGLKGFCPVKLHDDRELIDTKPEFHSTYRGQKFHFSSVEAKLKFDEQPARYAPAAYGADVVALTRDKDVVEGSLDFAAWFKGRLYLFGSEEAHDTFVADPALYATPVGIE